MVDHEEDPLAGTDPADDGELSGQLADESGEPGEDAEEFLSDEQVAAYGWYRTGLHDTSYDEGPEPHLWWELRRD